MSCVKEAVQKPQLAEQGSPGALAENESVCVLEAGSDYVGGLQRCCSLAQAENLYGQSSITVEACRLCGG